MAGDDISLPERIARTIQAWHDHGERPDLIAANVFDMTEDGHDVGIKQVDRLQEWRGVEHWAQRRPYVIGAAHAITRRLFDRFGPLANNVFHDSVKPVELVGWLLESGLHRVRMQLQMHKYIWDPKARGV